jgi:hypothetical protein
MSYKASIRPQKQQQQQQQQHDPAGEKYKSKAQSLQEFFPDYSIEGQRFNETLFQLKIFTISVSTDLQSLLAEVGGDVDLAATRISEG